MKKTGIWIDREKAHIITIEGEMETLETVNSEIERFNTQGGTGARFTSGPQDVIKETTYLEREKQQFKNYFKAIASKIQDAHQLVIFGPAGTNVKFKKELDTNFNNISTKVKDVVKADSMTNNQLRAWVREFFGSN